MDSPTPTQLALRMIAQMSNAELNQAIEQIKRRRKLLNVQALCNIGAGDRVTFTDRDGLTRTGAVTKLGRTKLTVREVRPDGSVCNWSVPPTMCTLAPVEIKP